MLGSIVLYAPLLCKNMVEDKNYTIVDKRDGGKTIGVYKFTPDHHTDRFEMIANLVEDWARVHPNEMKEILDEAKRIRREGNEYGSATGKLKDKGFRRGLILPAGLQVILKKNFPEVFTNKALYHKMLKRFPGFTVINKI